MEDRKLGTGRPRWLCRWWLLTRPCARGEQLDSCGAFSPSIEFFVPWWAWPLELLHRAIFGSTRLSRD